MPMPNKDIRFLANDLEEDLIKLKSKVAAIMVQDLQESGPWWTGHFATSWKVSETPVEPIKKSTARSKERQAYDVPLGWITDEEGSEEGGSIINQIRTNRFLPKRKRPKRVPLNKELYIGNEAEYAGFAVNNPGATAPVGDPDGVTYEQHDKNVENRITPPSKNPDWFKVYMQTAQYESAIALGLSETFKPKNVSFD